MSDMAEDNIRMERDGRWRAYRMAGWIVLVVVGLGGWFYFIGTDQARRAWWAFLVNFLFFTPLAAGLVTWGAVVRACHGTWMGQLEGQTAAGLAFGAPSVVALGALWAGSPIWAPWHGKAVIQGFWLNNTFIFARDLSLLALFWAVAGVYVARRRSGRGQTLKGVFIVLYAIVFSRIGFDLVMALDNRWYSTLFGGYFLVSGMYIAVTAWAFMAAWRPGTGKEQLRDLGTMVLAFSLLTTYMMYSQLLPIWYESLPKEVRFVIPRRNFFPWAWISIGLIALVYLGPLILLLTRWAKRTPWVLGSVCAFLLAGLWVERWWLVAPRFFPAPRFGLVEASITAAFLGVTAFALELGHRRMQGIDWRESEEP